MQLRCREIMTPDPISCEPGETVVRAAQMMKERNVGALPVVESKSSRRLVGIVTDRDLVVRVLASGRKLDSATVKEAMTPNPATGREDDEIEKAVKLMGERQIRRLPVVDADGRLTGMIAQADVATRVNQDKTTGELVEAISDPGTVRK